MKDSRKNESNNWSTSGKIFGNESVFDDESLSESFELYRGD